MLRDSHHGKPCVYCQRQMDRGSFHLQPTRDHVLPLSRGGTVKVIACAKCNGIKGDMLPEVWNAFMEEHPRWWKLSKTELRAIRHNLIGNGKVRPYQARRRQGTAKLPVIVPPALIFGEAS